MVSITKEQWRQISMNFLGLRSGATADDIGSAASYVMNMGLAYTFKNFNDEAPVNWGTRLDGTLDTIRAFPNAATRYLLIVKPSTGTSDEYSGCFPKCSAKPSSVLASTSIGTKSTEELATWVAENIPSA